MTSFVQQLHKIFALLCSVVLHTRYRLFQIGDEFLWNMTEAVQGPRALWRKHTGQRIATWMFYVRTSFSVVFCLLLDGFVLYIYP